MDCHYPVAICGPQTHLCCAHTSVLAGVAEAEERAVLGVHLQHARVVVLPEVLARDRLQRVDRTQGLRRPSVYDSIAQADCLLGGLQDVPSDHAMLTVFTVSNKWCLLLLHEVSLLVWLLATSRCLPVWAVCQLVGSPTLEALDAAEALLGCAAR